MDALLNLEPREAGFHVVEPTVSFDETTSASYDRTRCAGCCQENTAVDIATHSVTQ
jgi:hypothetical protein